MEDDGNPDRLSRSSAEGPREVTRLPFGLWLAILFLRLTAIAAAVVFVVVALMGVYMAVAMGAVEGGFSVGVKFVGVSMCLLGVLVAIFAMIRGSSLLSESMRTASVVGVDQSRPWTAVWLHDIIYFATFTSSGFFALNSFGCSLFLYSQGVNGARIGMLCLALLGAVAFGLLGRWALKRQAAW